MVSPFCEENAFWKIRKSDAPAFVYPDGTFISYTQLADDMDAFSEGIDWSRGPIGIQCNGQYRQYVAYLAALNAGCPVLLMGEKQPADTTGISLAHVYSAATNETVSRGSGVSAWHGNLAVLLSTSGSTGSSKWVRLSRQNIGSNAVSIADYLSLTASDRAPMALPFQYSYGMSVVNSHLAVGAAIVLMEGSVFEGTFWETFKRCGCTSFAGVPYSFDLIEQAGIRTAQFDNLRYMTQAGGRLEPARVQQWVERGRAEGWDFYVMYGQTEASPRISYLPPSMALTTPSSIGIPIPAGEMWVEDEHGAVLADGISGELCYRGPNTMMGYAQSDVDLRLGQGSDVLRTGDVARRLPNGAFEIVGRKSRFVKLFGLRIGLDEVEKRLEEMGLEAVCVAREEVLYVVQAKDSVATDIDNLDQKLAAWLGLPARSFRIVHLDTLPRQMSGKVDYLSIGEMLDSMQSQVLAEAEAQPSYNRFRRLADRVLLRRRKTVDEVFRAHFPQASVSPATSFDDLGGDSLSYVTVALELEYILGQLPKNWPTMSVAELETETVKGSWMTSVEMPTTLRALAILMVVAGHFNFLNYGGGGASTLMVIGGISFAVFTLPQVLQSANVVPMAVLAIRVALITVSFTLLNFSVTGYGEWPAFLLVGNWISPSVQGSAWFVEIYLQLLCALMILLAIPQVRRILDEQTFRTSAIAVVMMVVVATMSDMFANTDHLFRRLPHIYAWMFLIGVVAAYARSESEKSITTLIFLLGIWQFRGFDAISFDFFFFAVLALIWFPAVKIPRPFVGGIRMIAGASLIIYLSHFQFARVSTWVFGDYPVVSWIFAIVGGVVIWRMYDPFDSWLSERIRTLFFAKHEPVAVGANGRDLRL
jgi:acyl-coenzyme A synthetase/AMP-(fatty) acid ligase/peptidoglycan/LPS O-acetylase OafA/YrhL